jgi:peptidoglycan/LPS O-acetylase OafA/YrhL
MRRELDPMKYHPEIDGLRALSVLAVVFYHVGYSWMPGGFVGVDVFFVISGFLITRLLIEGHDQHNIGFIDFYIRRIKRLAPALLVMIGLCLIAGSLVLSPGDYKVFSASALYTLIALSNLYFLHNTGYFDPSSQSLALLHTWSLAVEEQFYLAWPASLWGLRKPFGKSPVLLLTATVSVLVISFSLNLYAVSVQEMAGFYLAQNRAWELLIGAVLALMGHRRAANLPPVWCEALPALGLAAILYAATHFSKSNSYPGFAAALPVFGAAAYLFPAGRDTLVHRMFGARMPVLVGRASYSLYLYHWPILVFWLHCTSFAPLTAVQRPVLVIVSGAMGFASWAFVEERFRRRVSTSWRVAAGFVTTGLAVATLSAAVVVRDGFPERIPASLRALSSFPTMWAYEGCAAQPSAADCETGRPWTEAQHRIALIGDSNAAHVLPLLTAAATGHDVALGLIKGCSPLIDGTRTIYYGHNDPLYNQNCGRSAERFIGFLRSHPDISLVVFSSAWWNVGQHMVPKWYDPATRSISLIELKSAFDNLIADISFLRVPVIFISAVPAWSLNPVQCVIAQQTSLIRRTCAMKTDRFSLDYFNRDQKLAADLLRDYNGQHNITVISPEDYLCNGADCMATLNGEFLYADQWHLRRNLIPETRAALARLLHFEDIIAASERDLPTISGAANARHL